MQVDDIIAVGREVQVRKTFVTIDKEFVEIFRKILTNKINAKVSLLPLFVSMAVRVLMKLSPGVDHVLDRTKDTFNPESIIPLK